MQRATPGGAAPQEKNGGQFTEHLKRRCATTVLSVTSDPRQRGGAARVKGLTMREAPLSHDAVALICLVSNACAAFDTHAMT